MSLLFLLLPVLVLALPRPDADRAQAPFQIPPGSPSEAREADHASPLLVCIAAFLAIVSVASTLLALRFAFRRTWAWLARVSHALPQKKGLLQASVDEKDHDPPSVVDEPLPADPPSLGPVDSPPARRRPRLDGLDVALAMQLRPGLGIGADAAWMVRFLMAMFGWFAVALTSG